MPDRLTDERVMRIASNVGAAVGELLRLNQRVIDLEAALADKWDVECANCGLRFTTQHPDAPEEVALFRTAKKVRAGLEGGGK